MLFSSWRYSSCCSNWNEWKILKYWWNVRISTRNSNVSLNKKQHSRFHPSVAMKDFMSGRGLFARRSSPVFIQNITSTDTHGRSPNTHPGSRSTSWMETRVRCTDGTGDDWDVKTSCQHKHTYNKHVHNHDVCNARYKILTSYLHKTHEWFKCMHMSWILHVKLHMYHICIDTCTHIHTQCFHTCLFDYTKFYLE